MWRCVQDANHQDRCCATLETSRHYRRRVTWPSFRRSTAIHGSSITNVNCRNICSSTSHINNIIIPLNCVTFACSHPSSIHHQFTILIVHYSHFFTPDSAFTDSGLLNGFVLVFPLSFSSVRVITGRICPKGSSAGISFTHGPIFGFFAPQGAGATPTRCTDQGKIWRGGPLLHAKFHLDRSRGGGLRPPKLKKWNFTNKIVHCPCTIFTKFARYMRVRTPQSL